MTHIDENEGEKIILRGKGGKPVQAPVIDPTNFDDAPVIKVIDVNSVPPELHHRMIRGIPKEVMALVISDKPESRLILEAIRVVEANSRMGHQISTRQLIKMIKGTEQHTIKKLIREAEEKGYIERRLSDEGYNYHVLTKTGIMIHNLTHLQTDREQIIISADPDDTDKCVMVPVDDDEITIDSNGDITGLRLKPDKPKPKKSKSIGAWKVKPSAQDGDDEHIKAFSVNAEKYPEFVEFGNAFMDDLTETILEIFKLDKEGENPDIDPFTKDRVDEFNRRVTEMHKKAINDWANAGKKIPPEFFDFHPSDLVEQMKESRQKILQRNKRKVFKTFDEFDEWAENRIYQLLDQEMPPIQVLEKVLTELRLKIRAMGQDDFPQMSAEEAAQHVINDFRDRIRQARETRATQHIHPALAMEIMFQQIEQGKMQDGRPSKFPDSLKSLFRMTFLTQQEIDEFHNNSGKLIDEFEKGAENLGAVLESKTIAKDQKEQLQKIDNFLRNPDKEVPAMAIHRNGDRMTPVIAFRHWIARFQDDEGIKGELARGIIADWKFPKTNDYDKIKKYFERDNPEDDLNRKMVNLFDEVWDEYWAEMKYGKDKTKEVEAMSPDEEKQKPTIADLFWEDKPKLAVPEVIKQVEPLLEQKAQEAGIDKSDLRKSKVWMLYIGGYHPNKIAEETGMSLPTIYNYLADLTRVARDTMADWFKKNLPLEFKRQLEGLNDLIRLQLEIATDQRASVKEKQQAIDSVKELRFQIIHLMTNDKAFIQSVMRAGTRGEDEDE